MKLFAIILCSFFSVFVHSQSLDLSSDQSVREYLNEKSFRVGEYGEITFVYEKYDREFGSLEFKVSYQTKEQTIPLKARVLLMLDDFSFPGYVRSVILSSQNLTSPLLINAPTIFQLFSNGELYYQDKSTLSMGEYIESITTGKTILKSPIYKLCH